MHGAFLGPAGAAGGRPFAGDVFSWDAVAAQATREDAALMELDLWDVAVEARAREAVASPASPPC